MENLKNRHNNDDEKSIYYLSSLFVCFQYSDGFVLRIYIICIYMYMLEGNNNIYIGIRIQKISALTGVFFK